MGIYPLECGCLWFSGGGPGGAIVGTCVDHQQKRSLHPCRCGCGALEIRGGVKRTSRGKRPSSGAGARLYRAEKPPDAAGKNEKDCARGQ